jgi:hypothetical protein
MNFMGVYTGFEISATFEIESVSHFRGTRPHSSRLVADQDDADKGGKAVGSLCHVAVVA